ncbi:N-formylglutamate amidohydrolase [Commensalibacter papalotli (ex Servin-Garciduenas et al. 2014)]|uniref:N-formylglutamate amidohydrolase n=1 Tax=Commensalibacter papalotli (ex Servin-Garciduenas et al. 2014) TaxID=1208583 RepID=W7DNI7_9PROT|nr:N-formylglutamate amidohydrolase [Commensalibacter papalotli (ex Servin-Garciduenas et al. 2014)]EUK18847.1 N-formylglutamate amidohydrolase [Commensalibacter papalotli (ex Servin-Garciduenas et al. 2014)]
MLLDTHDPHPVSVINKESLSPFFMVCDHAGCLIPSQLKTLGLQQSDLCQHIAWDIGIQKVGEAIAVLIDTTFVAQTYSRLVIDCNRGLNNSTLIPEVSDCVEITGNINLTLEQKQARITEIYQPYHQTISQLIDERLRTNIETIFISLHSFTPEMKDGFKRPWHAGILHGQDNQFSMVFKKILEENYAYPIGDNQPYALSPKNDYTVPTHAYQKKLPYLELEIRQDLITTADQQQEWADRLSLLLPLALQEYRAICS